MASASQAVAIVTEVLSRGVVLFQCLRPNSPGIGGLSLITQELFLLTYIARYLDLLALIVSIQDTLVKVRAANSVEPQCRQQCGQRSPQGTS